MKIYGYTEEMLSIEPVQPAELMEVSLLATPDELKKIAEFLLSSAKKMEKMGAKYSHEHLSDQQHSFKDSPQFIVFNPYDY